MSNVYGEVFGAVFGDVFDYATAYVTPTWTSTMLDLWEFEWDELSGAYATYGAFTFRVIKNPTKSNWIQSVGSNDKMADTVLDFLRTDAIACGLYQILTADNPPIKRPIVTISGKRYTLNRLENDDDTQPSIRPTALLLQ